MPLETASFLPDLVPSNPAHTDPLSQADSHTRLIKSTLKNTFPNFTDVALASTQAQLDAAAGVAAGTAVHVIPAGTAALPGLTALGSPSTGWWSPSANQWAFSVSGVQTLLMGGTAIVTTMGVAAAAFATTGSYSGGTGQLVPIGSTLIWWDDVLPVEGGYCWANGQIIANAATVCPILLARWGSRFGGDGVTTMGVPDLRDTVPVGKSTMGGAASRALQTLANTVLGKLFGAANAALALANLPPLTPSGSIANGAISTTQPLNGSNGSAVGTSAGSNTSVAQGGMVLINLQQGASTFYGNAMGGSSQAFSVVQPSTTCNYILRLA